MTVGVEPDVFRAAFEGFEARVAGSDPAWLRPLRAAAFARYAELGLPTTRIEEWRFTSIAPIARTPFLLSAGEGSAGVTAEALGPQGLGIPPTAVFVNGRLSPALSSLSRSAKGVEVLSLRDVLAREPGRLQPYLARAAREDGNAFTALNTAFVDDGAVVFVAPGTAATEPVHVHFFSTHPGRGEARVAHVRNLVVAGPGSQAKLVESYGGPAGEVYFTNVVTEIVLEDGALLDRYQLQRESEAAFHVASVAVRQGRGSRFANHAISLGGVLSRNQIHVRLGGEGGECVLNGLFMPRGDQHMDTHTLIAHASPHCSSREAYRGILSGRSRGVFHGRILVEKGAQKTDAYQVNKNLLLSREALVNSTPALEIHADDVKCKHGSTTGQLDEAAVFYLRSRGIGEAAARSLLTYAFAADIVQRIDLQPVRAALEAQLQERLPGVGEVREAVA